MKGRLKTGFPFSDGLFPIRFRRTAGIAKARNPLFRRPAADG
ncbi:hypothetical protein [Kingella potus]|nr:hypothetical protein [Kingella potus]